MPSAAECQYGVASSLECAGGALPVTGVELGLIVLVALILIPAGIILRRLSRR